MTAAKFCPDCGTAVKGERFCSNCGRQISLGADVVAAAATSSAAAPGTATPPATKRFALKPSQVVGLIGAANTVIGFILSATKNSVTIVKFLDYTAGVGISLWIAIFATGIAMAPVVWLAEKASPSKEDPKWLLPVAVIAYAVIAILVMILIVPGMNPNSTDEFGRISMAVLGLAFIVVPIGFWWYFSSKTES